MDVLDTIFFNNTILKWLVALGATIGIYFIVQVIKLFVVRHLAKLAKKTATQIDDILIAVFKQTKPILVLIVSLYLGSMFLALPEKVGQVIKLFATGAFFFQLALWGNSLIENWIKRARQLKFEKDPATASAFGALSFFARLLVWSLVGFLILDNFGIDITALVAGLGVGGIAIALAMQSILGDIFCSVAILIDKPFEVGDFIIVDDKLGTVEKIGIKTTRVRSLSGEQLVFSNADLVSSRIRNYKRMNERRVLFSFGVVYQTSVEKLEAIPAAVKEIIESIDRTRFDRTHFKEYGDSSLNFECVYYVLDRDYNLYMDIQQKINLAIFRKFEKEGIEFAYPTQTLYISK